MSLQFKGILLYILSYYRLYVMINLLRLESIKVSGQQHLLTIIDIKERHSHLTVYITAIKLSLFQRLPAYKAFYKHKL